MSQIEKEIERLGAKSSFPAADQASAKVVAERGKNWNIRANIQTLREQVECAEAEVRLLGSEAQAMPDDLGDWEKYGPRVQGLVTRICQTQAQSEALAKAITEDAKNSN